jgi:hypothetical protein
LKTSLQSRTSIENALPEFEPYVAVVLQAQTHLSKVFMMQVLIISVEDQHRLSMLVAESCRVAIAG